MSGRMRRLGGAALAPLALAVVLVGGPGCTARSSDGGAGAAGADRWAGAALVSPAELAAQLADSTAPKPMLLHVGFQVLYRGGAIPGTRYIGSGSRPDGIAALRAAVRDLPRDRDIVLYCGCCPWEHCPNMLPAYTAMREMGFTRVRAMRIDHNFDEDWAARGYPVVKPAD